MPNNNSIAVVKKIGKGILVFFVMPIALVSAAIVILAKYEKYFPQGFTLLNADPGKQASMIVKKQLRSPGSFNEVSNEILWKGKTKLGEPAYVVSVGYDAQNAFGALLRGCMIVAYAEKAGNQITWNPLLGTQEADNFLCDASLPEKAKLEYAVVIARLNFGD